MPALAIVPRGFADGVITELNVMRPPTHVQPEGVVEARDNAAVAVSKVVEKHDGVKDVLPVFDRIGGLLSHALRPTPDGNGFVLSGGMLRSDGAQVTVYIAEVRSAIGPQAEIIDRCGRKLPPVRMHGPLHQDNEHRENEIANT